MTIQDAIEAALKRIDPEHVSHPGLGLQERVVCYELYHQLRVLEKSGDLKLAPARLQGELNKTGQHYFLDIVKAAYAQTGEELNWAISEAIPDLLIHDPHNNRANLLVMEVKRSNSSAGDRERDIAKLALFSADPLNYSHRVFLLINDGYKTAQELLADVARLSRNGAVTIDAAIYTPRTHEVIFGELTYDLHAAVELFRKLAAERGRHATHA